MIKMKGLGRGLDALLAGSDKPQGDEQRNLPIDHLQPGKYQPRSHMDAQALAELAASIKTQGIMQPILVRAVNSAPVPSVTKLSLASAAGVPPSKPASTRCQYLSGKSRTNRRWPWR